MENKFLLWTHNRMYGNTEKHLCTQFGLGKVGEATNAKLVINNVNLTKAQNTSKGQGRLMYNSSCLLGVYSKVSNRHISCTNGKSVLRQHSTCNKLSNYLKQVFNNLAQILPGTTDMMTGGSKWLLVQNIYFQSYDKYIPRGTKENKLFIESVTIT